MKEFLDELKNWWWYNKRFVLIGVVVLAICGYMFAQASNEVEPDYFAGLVGTAPRSPEEIAALEKRLKEAGLDINGDGQVELQLKCYNIALDGQSGHNSSEEMLALDGDIVAGISGIFLLEDPAAFQEKTGGILAEPFVELESGLYAGLRFDADESYIDLFAKLS